MERAGVCRQTVLAGRVMSLYRSWLDDFADVNKLNLSIDYACGDIVPLINNSCDSFSVNCFHSVYLLSVARYSRAPVFVSEEESFRHCENHLRT